MELADTQNVGAEPVLMRPGALPRQFGWTIGVLSESRDVAVDTEERLPDEFRADQETRDLATPSHYSTRVPTVEVKRTVPPMSPNRGHAPCDRAGLVHQVAEDQSVTEGNDRSGAKQQSPQSVSGCAGRVG